jgi:O-antigen/teichoic acid export membrane protein
MIAGLTRFLSVSAIVFAARILGAGIAVLIQILLARVLGPDALGVFYMATSAVAVLAVVVAAGYPNLMVRFVARYRERGRPGLVAAFLRRSQIDMLVLALAAMVGLMVFALCHPAAKPEIGMALISAAPAIPALAMMRINGSFAVAVRQFTQSWILDLVARPLLLLVALGGMVMVGTQFSVVLVVLLSR